MARGDFLSSSATLCAVICCDFALAASSILLSDVGSGAGKLLPALVCRISLDEVYDFARCLVSGQKAVAALCDRQPHSRCSLASASKVAMLTQCNYQAQHTKSLLH